MGQKYYKGKHSALIVEKEEEDSEGVKYRHLSCKYTNKMPNFDFYRLYEPISELKVKALYT